MVLSLELLSLVRKEVVVLGLVQITLTLYELNNGMASLRELNWPKNIRSLVFTTCFGYLSYQNGQRENSIVC
jgi:hypothetical protein